MSKRSVNSNLNRDTRVVQSTACPVCGAKPGERCRRPEPWPHSGRRVAWSETKREQGGEACPAHSETNTKEN